MSKQLRYTPDARFKPLRYLFVPTKKAHQAAPVPAVVEPGPPPPVALPRWRPTALPAPPRLRGQADARHPSEDGEPMASNTRQARRMVDAEYVLRFRYSPRKDVFVGIDLLVYYTEGPKPKSVAPDVFVSFDVPSYPREIYRLSEEGKPPDWVLEIASPTTYQKDVGDKKKLYESMGVGEYFVFDPQGGMHDPRLQGWVLQAGGYAELADLRRPGVPVALWSEALGLELHFDGVDLRLWDPAQQAYLRTIDKSEAEREVAIEEREVAESKLEIETLARREAERRGDIAEAERDAEAQARREAEARVAALEAELKRRRP